MWKLGDFSAWKGQQAVMLGPRRTKDTVSPISWSRGTRILILFLTSSNEAAMVTCYWMICPHDCCFTWIHQNKPQKRTRCHAWTAGQYRKQVIFRIYGFYWRLAYELLPTSSWDGPMAFHNVRAYEHHLKSRPSHTASWIVLEPIQKPRLHVVWFLALKNHHPSRFTVEQGSSPEDHRIRINCGY